LDSYLRGNRQAMSVVAVPSPELEQQRSVVRFREQLMRDRRRAEARGRALSLSQGLLAPRGWWRPAAWEPFSRELPEWMRPQLTYWQQEALALQAQEYQVRQHLERMVRTQLPVGVGAFSWITLQLEIRGSRPLPKPASDRQLHRPVPGHPPEQWPGPRRLHQPVW
jgi:hypothetical protein